MKNISTIILAAGESKRINSNYSKIFHKLSDLSLIEHVYNTAFKISKNNIYIICNKKNIYQIQQLLPNAKTIIQKKPLGTADAVLCSKKFIPKNKRILILFGDVPLIKSKTIKNLIDKYKPINNFGSLLVFKAKNPFGYGRVITEKNIIKNITEEVEANESIKKIKLCNSGIMFCNHKDLFKNLIKIKNQNIKKEKFITDIFDIAYNQNKAFTYSICDENELLGINTRNDLINLDNKMQKELKNKLIKNGVTILQPDTVRVSYDTKIAKDTIIEPFVVIKKGVTIKKNVTIKSHTIIENCVIGENSVIGPSARIRPYTKIGKKVKIGNFVEIKNSVINDSSAISHLSYIGDSFIGKNVNIGAGTITCNFNGKQKNKTIIKNNVFVGSNVSLIAPITIGSNSTIGAGSVISKNVPPNSLSIERTEQKIIKKRR